MTNQKLNIEAIAGIQEIDDAAAANCNGGFDIELYKEFDFAEVSGSDG